MIKIRDLEFEYFSRDEDNYLEEMITAIRGINFDTSEGEFIGIAGRNGSGKSTFAKILNRLIVPIEGKVDIFGFDALDPDNILDIRKHVGMVFQNPDNQIIGSVVEEDIAFGMENLGFENDRMHRNVEKAAFQVGLISDEMSSKDRKKILTKRIDELSGGSKQKVAIAGILAMETKCIVLDESTSMLDEKSRQEIIKVLLELKKKGFIVILITHLMDELLMADTIYVFDKGKICLKGRRNKVFSDEGTLKKHGLDIPELTKLVNCLFDNKIIKNKELFSVEDISREIFKDYPYAFKPNIGIGDKKKEKKRVNPSNAILFDKVSHSFEKEKVLTEISISISKGEYVGIVGETGAGKSTLLQMIPGLIKPKKGTVYVDGLDVFDRNTSQKDINRKIGFLFQYPEHQLFAKNVYEDVLFGPSNLGISKVEAEKRAYEAIELVGLSDEVYDLPMDRLSGGQRRRVALAGVLAMKPDYLILDEPTAGLDPEGRDEMLAIIQEIHRQSDMTIVMVSHDIDNLVKYADTVFVLKDGRVVESGTPGNAFYNYYVEYKDNNAIPTAMKLTTLLRENGMPIDCSITEIEQCVNAIKEVL